MPQLAISHCLCGIVVVVVLGPCQTLQNALNKSSGNSGYSVQYPNVATWKKEAAEERCKRQDRIRIKSMLTKQCLCCV